jgi:hypothetical protein
MYTVQYSAVDSDGATSVTDIALWPASAGGNGHWYAVVDADRDWAVAKAYAESLGGQLVSINTAEEQAFLASTFLTNGGEFESYWTGLTDSAQEGTWVWLDGTPLTYSNWNLATNEPNDFNGEDYGILNFHFAKQGGSEIGTWNDEQQIDTHGFTRMAIVEFTTRPYPLTVTVTNPPPLVSAGDDATINEGATLSRSGSFGDGSPSDTWSAQVNYGDGSGWQPLALSPSKTFALSHAYADDGAYHVQVSVTDSAGGIGTDELLVTVNNVAPTLTIAGAGSVDEGGTYALSLSSSDPGTDTISSWTINWGDGGSDTVSGSAASASHVYADGPNAYTITATATDEDGTFAANSLVVSVNNVAPAVTVDHATVTVNEGQTATNSGTWFDPGDDVVTLSASAGSVTRNPDGTWAWSLTTTDGPDQSGTVTVTATDGDGESSTTSFLLTVNNVAPTLTISGNASVAEGSTYTLHLASGDPGADTISSWTINWGDGSTQTVGGLPSAATHVYADGPNGYTITATASDEDGTYNANSLAVSVSNVAPTITSLTGPASGVRGQPRRFSATFGDPGVLDTHTKAWTVRNAAGQVVATGAGSTLDFTPTAAGTYTVEFTVTDNAGAAATGVATLVVTAFALQADPGDPGKTVLVIGGTIGADDIKVQPGPTAGTYQVLINGVSQGVFAPTGGIVVYAQAGADTVKMNGSVVLPVTVWGGDGNDTINGGNGGGVLIGGAGDDNIKGGSGRDILIGGAGADGLNGGDGDDILIAGTTSYDDDVAALSAIRAEWSRADRTYQGRVNALSGIGSGLNGIFLLRAQEPGRTVFDDGGTTADVLTGAVGTDWFLSNTQVDVITDKAPSEASTPVSP